MENRSGFRGRGDWGGGLTEAPKLEKAEGEDGKAQRNSDQDYDAKNRSERLKVGKMPVSCGGSGGRGKRETGTVSGDGDRGSGMRVMPRLQQREEQADGEERSPGGGKNGRLLNPQGAGQNSCH